MKRSILFVLVALSLSPQVVALEGDATSGSAEIQSLAAGNEAFAFELYSVLRGGEGNIFLSPHSVSTALSMAWIGARGETETQMADALNLPEAEAFSDTAGAPAAIRREGVARAFAALKSGLESRSSEGSHEFAEADAFWGQEGHPFLDSFLALARDGFGSEVERLDFHSDAEGAMRAINAWTEHETGGKVPDLLSPGDLDPLVRAVLTNAVYFKGQWARRFDPAATREVAFHREPGCPEKDVAVPMMFQTADFRYAHLAEERASVVELPYAGGAVAMFVLLPDEDASGGLPALEEMLTPENVDGWLGLMTETRVAVRLPSFRMTWGTEDLVPALRELGMTEPFGDAADFSGMDGTTELYVSKVLHKAFVDVNEEGTEAAAATAVVTRLKAESPVAFTADRPFLFLIRDASTGSILFMGRVADPSA